MSQLGQTKIKFKINYALFTDSTEIASKFKSHISGIAKVLNAHIGSLREDTKSNEKNSKNSFIFLNTNAEEIYNKILSLKLKSAQIDEVPS